MSEVKPRKAMVRSSSGIRDMLMDEMERLANGETDAKSASAMARLGQCIVSTVQLELEVQRFKDAVPKQTVIDGTAHELPSLTLSSRRAA